MTVSHRLFAGGALLLLSLLPLAASAQKIPAQHQPHQKTLLAVFAHPDDETIVSPVLAAYARQGVKVYLVVATDGRMGIMPHAGIPAGDQLAKVRAGEVQCAAKELGIEPPILIGLPDAGLAAIKPAVAYPGEPLDKLAKELRRIVDELDPQVIISWGPEGAYGHPDHRLVGDVVMQLFLEGGMRMKGRHFYWIGFPPERVASAPLWYGFKMYGTDPALLTAKVAFTPQDLATARKDIGCHKSQATTAMMNESFNTLSQLWKGGVQFYEWRGGNKNSGKTNGVKKTSDLFY
ncbi:MAG: PIG-L family deacetylase [Acidobacteriota bacterium]|nr:PIG-L family deacetylase [Acidobacteriota bacterium]